MSYQKQIDKSDILRYESNIHSPTTLDSASIYITASRMISGSSKPTANNDTWNFLRSWYYCSGSFPNWKGNIDGSSHASNRNSPYRYFMKGYFVYVATDGLSTENMNIGAGKMFTLRGNIFVDPKIVYNMEEKTTNLTLGFGLKF